MATLQLTTNNFLNTLYLSFLHWVTPNVEAEGSSVNISTYHATCIHITEEKNILT